MKSSMQLISTLFFLVILVVAPGMKMVVEGQPQLCETKSLNYRGLCLKWRSCKRVCISEGFPDGRCKGFFNNKCVCRKPCALLSTEN
ncbi:putative defensin-like protein 9 [Arabidopsis thaliana]|uniref:Putative defensin-like protein 9 n=5 Tax=Arabidopsis TaxID=3701 RepID=DEF09_ARATH|nr:low-molecular-weight cysteine-rich 76 [Arabidopsis thaliana]P82785.1 RecName: Full=Putative defensin-like protein 9; AltName: Full=Putative low-molecular-weight cysteine-rich protein 76; Short=Protein LCR76; Flags: Precursor [Arabidopsis thaliana]KAG7638156.1 Knottin scorpion toxin-like [Arabidopsis thaliana x Arabidopsis arenosa]KAG7642777.1 Knottin scorpion toxin-like [Arabidopsis suecica]AEC08607.1 low-molecular-weight cysteine-rich 76 [Arabidopsis thaliana]OAP08348.1 LCR76 [Arabidopsis |eukprot:NP_001031460.1 low-molecular-weight cysteine-rich 76 [Arabidopsis thaliana]